MWAEAAALAGAGPQAGEALEEVKLGKQDLGSGIVVLWHRRAPHPLPGVVL